MRTSIALLSALAVTSTTAQTVTSISAGSASAPATWSCNCVPGATHDIVVGHVVTAIGNRTYHGIRVTNGGHFTKTAGGVFNILMTLDIDAGGVFQNNGSLTVSGDYICDGTHSGTGLTKLEGVNTTLSGTGTITNVALFSLGNGNKTVLPGTALVKVSNSVRVQNITVTNQGTFDLDELTGNGIWVNATGSVLKVREEIRNAMNLHSSAIDNRVEYLRTDSGAQIIADPADGAYHDLFLQANSTVQMRRPKADLVVNGDLTIMNCTFDVRRNGTNHDVVVKGDWINTTGALNPRTATITLGGNAVSHVFQPANQPFYNVVIAGTDTVKIDQAITVNGNMTITGSLDVQDPGNHQIIVKGNWTCSGELIPRYGKVVLQGTSAQIMSGESYFHELELSNTSTGATIASGPQHVRGVLTLTDGNLTANGWLDIESGATYGDARVAPITGGSISGNVRVARYIDAGATNWRFLTSPASGRTLQDWEDDLVTSGYPGSAFPAFPFISIYGYNEAVPGTEDDGFVPASSSAEAIAQGEGYWVWCGDSLGGTAPFTIDVTGPLYTGDRLLPVAYSNTGNPSGDGWTMVGNPYASAIDWDAPSWTKTNINNAIHIWNPDAENFAGYVGGVSINGGSRYIASGQAFWVQANASSPLLRATENVKSSVAVGFKTSGTDLDILRLRVVGNGMADETVLRVAAGATTAFDGAFDAYEKFSATVGAPSISSKMPGNKNLMVNAVPPFSADTTFQVKVKVGAQASYAIQFSEVEGAFAASCMVLEDVVLGISTPIIEGGSYSFTMSPNYNGTRFRVHASAPAEVEVSATSCSEASDGSALVTGAGTGPWTYVWTDSDGNILQTHSVNGSDTLGDMAAGAYIVTIDGSCPQLMVEAEIPAPEPISATAVVVGNACNNTADGTIDLSVSGGTGPYTYAWSNGASTEDLNGLVPGNYFVGVADANDCFTSQGFELLPLSLVEAAFTMPANADMGTTVLFADASTGAVTYAWDFGDGTPVDNNTSPSHAFDIPGVYTVSLTIANGGCVSTVSGTIETVGFSTAVAIEREGGFSILQEGGRLVLVVAHDQELIVDVRNLLGQELPGAFRGRFAAGRHVIDLPATAAGVVLLHVADVSGKDSKVFKVVR